jgi:glycosyltransferase involved in cell wall biosynthesis
MYAAPEMKLAILIAAYNAERTIGETIASLQAISNGWEYIEQLIICDDGSTDNTIAAVERVGFNKCRLIIVRHNSNKGEAQAYRTMLGLLSREVQWFLILGHDDLALPCFIERNLEIMRTCGERVAAVSSNFLVFGDTSERLAHRPAKKTIVFRGGSEAEIHHTAVVGCWWHISGSLVNRMAWEQFDGTDPQFRYCADWDLILRWQNAGYLVGHSLVPTTKFREHAGSLAVSSRSQFRDIVDRANVVKKYPEIFGYSLRARWAGVLVIAILRRAAKQLLAGSVRTAIKGVHSSSAALLELVNHMPRA